MFRKLIGALLGLAMMGVAGSANAALSDNGITTNYAAVTHCLNGADRVPDQITHEA